MAISEKVSVRDIVVAIALLTVFIIAAVVVVKLYKQEGEKRQAEISDLGDKDPNHVEAFVKLLAVDPIKGDISARVEFEPKGNLVKDDGTLTRGLKFYVNSANGKQEQEFAKGKRMTPVDVVISLYDGTVTDYPFDQHKAFLEMWLTPVVEKAKTPATDAAKPAPSPEAAPATTPAAEGGTTPAEPKKEEAAAKEEEDDTDVSLAVDFFGSMPGYKIEAAKTKDSDDDYVGIDMKVSRSSTVVFFSSFVMVLMWGATIAVMLLVLSVMLRGRKIEVGMFSFLAALIFALVALRNSQPAVPPIGTLSDFIAFFWAEVLLALCLLTIIFTWLARPGAK